MNIDDVFLLKNNSQSGVDIVYTFVNPYDLKWKKKYISTIGTNKIDNIRFDFGIDQIIFSMRTIEKYMPWINKIYIVHDNQQFQIESSFLNSKVVWVDHREIIPEQSLPTFNSRIIEAFLWKIPNISSHFLYLNDDMFLGSNVFKTDLVDDFTNKSIQFYHTYKYYNHPWSRNIKNTNKLFKNIFKNHIDTFPQHAPYFIETKIMQETYEYFYKDLKHMLLTDKIRTYNSYSHNLLFLYAMYASYHGYAINKKTSFSPIHLKKDFIYQLKNKQLRKKFYCFYSPIKSIEQEKLYKELQQVVLS